MKHVKAVCSFTTLLLAFCVMSCKTTRIGAIVHKITASDGYEITAYDLVNARTKKQPLHPRAIFLYMQGSSYESAFRNMDKLASAVIFGAKAILVEKRGCYMDTVDLAEAYKFSGKETRIGDYVTVMDTLLQGVATDVPLIVVGASEGGDIAAAFAKRYQRTSHLILIGSGGGISQRQELRGIVEKSPGAFGYRDVREIDSMFKVVERSGDSLDMWMGYPYKRWNSYMNDSSISYLTGLDIPILLIHGDADEMVPVRSARTIDSTFRSLGKTNLTYIEYPEVNHTLFNVRDHISRYPYLEVDMVKWLERQKLASHLEAGIFINRIRKRHKDIFAGQR